MARVRRAASHDSADLASRVIQYFMIAMVGAMLAKM